MANIIQTVFRSQDQGLEKGFDKATGAADEFGGSLKGIASNILGPLGTAAAIAILTNALKNNFNAFVNDNAQVALFSQQIGVSTEFLSEMIAVGTQFNLTQQQIEQGFQRANRRIGEFVLTGKSEAAPVLRELSKEFGVVFDEATTIETILPQLSELFRETGSETINMARAMRLFDTEGVPLLRVLSQGSAAVDKLRGSVSALGATLDEERATRVLAFKTEMAELQTALTGLRNDAMEPLLGPFKDLVTVTADFIAIIRLLNEMGDLEVTKAILGAFIPTFVKELPGIIRIIREDLAQVRAELTERAANEAEANRILTESWKGLATTLEGPVVFSLEDAKVHIDALLLSEVDQAEALDKITSGYKDITKETRELIGIREDADFKLVDITQEELDRFREFRVEMTLTREEAEALQIQTLIGTESQTQLTDSLTQAIDGSIVSVIRFGEVSKLTFGTVARNAVGALISEVNRLIVRLLVAKAIQLFTGGGGGGIGGLVASGIAATGSNNNPNAPMRVGQPVQGPGNEAGLRQLVRSAAFSRAIEDTRRVNSFGSGG